MTMHHIVSAACSGIASVTRRMHFWGCFGGCVEITTIFLNLLFATKQLAPKDSMPMLTAFSGMSLWLTFIVFRFGLLGLWFWMFYKDISSYPSETWDLADPIERYMFPS